MWYRLMWGYRSPDSPGCRSRRSPSRSRERGTRRPRRSRPDSPESQRLRLVLTRELDICRGGVGSNPAAPRVHRGSAASTVPLTTVTRISRSAVGAHRTRGRPAGGMPEARPLPVWLWAVRRRPLPDARPNALSAGGTAFRPAPRIDAAGMIAISGDARSENAGRPAARFALAAEDVFVPVCTGKRK